MYPAEKPWITFNIFKIYSHWTDFPICCISVFCAGHPSHLRCVSSNITSVSIVKTKEIPEIQIQSFYFEILPSDMFPAEVYLTWRSAGPPQHPGGDWSEKRGLTSCSLWGVDTVEVGVWGLWTTVHVCPCELWGGGQLLCVCSEVCFKVSFTSSDSCSRRGTGWGCGDLVSCHTAELRRCL